MPDAGGPVDVAVVAPHHPQANRRWLTDAIRVAATRLARDGVLAMIVPPRQRADARRIATRTGLVPIGAVLALPDGARPTRLASLTQAVLRDVTSRQLGWSVPAAGCAGAAARSRAGRELLRRTAPGCVLLVARTAAIDPLAWLAGLDASQPCTASVARGPREDARVAVVMRFPGDTSGPDLVVKAGLDTGGHERIERERGALATLAGAASAAGAEVPAPNRSSMPGLLAMNVLAGRRASHVLAREPDELDSITQAITAWLRRWNAATAVTRIGSRTLLDPLLVGPSSRLVATGAATVEYVAALDALTQRLEGREVILLAAHNDLTMANVLVAAGRIGVVDWEAATPAAPPLVDLWYALTDALARANRMEHAQAVPVLTGARRPPVATAALVEATSRALSLDSDQQLLGFHACWLHHAENELDRGMVDGPFSAVVRAIATTRLRWPTDAGMAAQ